MAYVLIFFGLLLTVAGTRGTQGQLFGLLQGDFTGQNSFIYWIAAIALIGAVGYVPAFKGFSKAFLALVLIVLIINQSKGTGTDVFSQFTNALRGTTQPATPSAQPSNQQGFDLGSLTKLASSFGSMFGNSGSVAA